MSARRRIVVDVAETLIPVVLVAFLLFAATGVWPPMVAVESGSMNPHLEKGDLVVVAEEHRYASAAAVEGTGVVTAKAGRAADYSTFGWYGDVVVYVPDGGPHRTPIIHRAMFWVDAGENWYDEADPAFVGAADDCEELKHCPAPHAGFITLGDANNVYDQATRRSAPVKPSWIRGRAVVRVPYLGWVRLAVTGEL